MIIRGNRSGSHIKHEDQQKLTFRIDILQKENR